MEAEMLALMLHKERDEERSPIGEFKPHYPASSEVGPLKKCVKEAKPPLGSRWRANLQQTCSSDSFNLGQRISASSGLDTPPGFEDVLGVDGPLKQGSTTS